LWIDDVRPAPEGYVWCRSVKEAKWRIETAEDVCTIFPLVDEKPPIELIDIDHDAGDYANDGGDYIRLLDWLEETGRNYPIRVHSQNVVGRMNMEAICRRNGWTEVK
jgi:hypothetical protein